MEGHLNWRLKKKTICLTIAAWFAFLALSGIAYGENKIYATIVVMDDKHNAPISGATVRPCEFYRDNLGQIINDTCRGCYYLEHYTDNSGMATVAVGGLTQPTEHWIKVEKGGYVTYCQPLRMTAEGITHKVWLKGEYAEERYNEGNRNRGSHSGSQTLNDFAAYARGYSVPSCGQTVQKDGYASTTVDPDGGSPYAVSINRMAPVVVNVYIDCQNKIGSYAAYVNVHLAINGPSLPRIDMNSSLVGEKKYEWHSQTGRTGLSFNLDEAFRRACECP